MPYLLLLFLGPTGPKEKLSEYGFFSDLKGMVPAEVLVEYELNTPLFTDYAWKKRFIYLPRGKVMEYHADRPFTLPVGSILIKNFYYPFDFRQPQKGYRVVETRLLIHEENGWKAWPYIWNDEQTDAVLTIQGGIKNVGWKHYNGKNRSISYLVPNINQCKGCHSIGGELQPIGIAARHLNRSGVGSLAGRNQLEALYRSHKLDSLPPSVPKNSVWNDPSTGTLDDRARSWLDINCAHCHSADGPASNTGLHLDRNVSDPTVLGVMKPPVAAGAASQDMQFDIVPGKPGESILLYRMETDEVGQRMPEIGRTIMDREGVALIREWIESLDQ